MEEVGGTEGEDGSHPQLESGSETSLAPINDLPHRLPPAALPRVEKCDVADNGTLKVVSKRGLPPGGHLYQVRNVNHANS